MISRRMANLKERVKIDTQRLREDALNGLEEHLPEAFAYQ